MKVHAIVCTRDSKQATHTFMRLLHYYSACGIQVSVVSGAKSIFAAYDNAFTKLNPDDEDIIIFSHDDIGIADDPAEFIARLKHETESSNTGFVGAAGTQLLTQDAVWWNQDVWKAGLHRGVVTHVSQQGRPYTTKYGSPGPVVVLDGLFLAAKAKVIKEVGLTKPDYFAGEWDFYDIHYTMTAHELGYTNKVMKLDITHNSRGELVGRDSWHQNRQAFIEKTKLPVQVREANEQQTAN